MTRTELAPTGVAQHRDAAATNLPGIEVLGSSVHLVSEAQTIAWMEDCIERCDGRCRQTMVTGFHRPWTAFQCPELPRGGEELRRVGPGTRHGIAMRNRYHMRPSNR